MIRAKARSIVPAGVGWTWRRLMPRSGSMPLLLLFSALLTALTGVVAGVRPIDMPVERHARASGAARQVAALAVSRPAGHRHLLGALGESAPFSTRRAVAAMTTGCTGGCTGGCTAPSYLDRPRT